jgi:hypothetical protein
MKTLILFLFLIAFHVGSIAQGKYFTKTGTIRIDATTNASPEKIGATNRTVSCVLDSKTGNLLFVVLMKGFEFEKALMQEHFNENYVESDKFPKADFKGQVTSTPLPDFSKEGQYPVLVKGLLTMHGQSKPVDAKGTVTVKDGKITLASSIDVMLSDYSISIPGLVADKVSKSASIVVDCNLQPFKG